MAKEFKLFYSPYTKEVVMEKKNKQGEYDSWEWKPLKEHLSGKFLQSWLRLGNNWQGFCYEIKNDVNEDFTLYFAGRDVDFCDLEAGFQQELKKNIKVTCKKLKESSLEDEDVLDNLSSLVTSLKSSPFAKTPQVESALASYEECLKGQLKIAVIAPMSSGKSTLLNALLGQELLAMSNDATTAKITRIYHQDTQQPFEFELRDKNEEILQDKEVATPEKLLRTTRRSDETENIGYVDLYGNIPDIITNKINLVLMDTPGPDSSEDVDHSMETAAVINDQTNQPIILFVMDATKVGTENEKKILNDIKSAIEKDPQSKERMIFVVNRADVINPENRESSETLLSKVMLKLTKMGIASPCVIPISAITGFYQRLLERGEISTEMTESLFGETEPVDDRFRDLQTNRMKLSDKSRDLVQVATLSPTCRTKVEASKEKAMAEKDFNALTWILCGMYGLQCTINEYLEKFAIPFKTHRCIAEIQGQMEDLQNKANFQEKIHSSAEALKKAQEILSNNEKKLEDLTLSCEELDAKLQMTGEEAETDELVENSLSDLLAKASTFWAEYTKKEVTKADAIDIKSDFQRTTSYLMADMKKELIPKLCEKEEAHFKPLYQEIEEITQKFQNIMSSFEHYDGNKIHSLKTVHQILGTQSDYNLDSFLKGLPLDSYTKTETRTKMVQNDNRKGFWGFFAVWEPWEVSEEYKVTLGEFVDLSQLKHVAVTELDKKLSEYPQIIQSGMQILFNEKRELAKMLNNDLRNVMLKETQAVRKSVDNVTSATSDKKNLEQNKTMLDRFVNQSHTVGIKKEEVV